ncbi:hypothetical protein Q7P37_005803 [Cladosporium fusiforme]
MAAALAPASAIDLKSSNTYSVRLGTSVLQESEGKRYRNVRYNYKPQPAQGATVSAKLLPGKQANSSSLSVQDGDKEWHYTGRHREADDMYVLVVSGDGKKAVTLEKLGSSHAVNLTRSPEDDDADSLARKHPYVTANDSDNEEDGMFGDESDHEDAAPDASNPFDFRHFLKSVQEESRREEPSSQTNKSTVGTPTPHHQRTPTVTPMPRSAKPTPASTAVKKRKTPSAAATRPNPKRVRAGEDPPPKATPSAKAPAPKANPTPVPEVRIDRKASLRHTAAPSIEQTSKADIPNDEDDGELILENSTADTKQNPTHLSAMSLALSGALGARGAGPISLRSAASSPASALNSPHLNNGANQEGKEFDFGGESSPEQEQHEFEFVDNDDDDDEDHGDVEDTQLPSPPKPEQSRQPPPPLPAQPRSRRASLAMQGADDEDDMEAQLALAMAADEEDDEPAPLSRVDESDEDVSEEE